MKILKLLAGYLVAVACNNTRTGMWSFELKELAYIIPMPVLLKYKSEFLNEFNKFMQVASADIVDGELELDLFLNYCGIAAGDVYE